LNSRIHPAFFICKDVRIFIPRDTAGGTLEERVERAVRWLWSRGLYPGPSAVTMRLHGKARRDLNDRETKVRNRLLEQLKIGRQRNYRRV
jgi:hypothetical protein